MWNSAYLFTFILFFSVSHLLHNNSKVVEKKSSCNKKCYQPKSESSSRIFHWVSLLQFWNLLKIICRIRGVFRISSREWRSNFQGVAKKLRLPPSAFDILDTCYKEIHKMYFFLLFLVRLLSFIRKFDSP